MSILLRIASTIGLTTCVSAVVLLISPPAHAGSSYPDREYHDRIVDAAALSSKLSAIRELKILIRQRHGTSDEPRLEMTLAELERDCADFEFRIAHGFHSSAIVSQNLWGYRKILEDSVSLLSGFIQKYPNHPKIARAYYLRGKALFELGRKNEASADFMTLLQRFPGRPDFKLAALAEIDLLMSIKDYNGVLRGIALLHADPSDRVYYPLALDRAGWANYYLNNIPVALQSLQKEVAYLNGPMASRASLTTKKSAYDSIALFYATAIQKKLPGYGVSGAFSYFRSIASGQDLGGIMIQFAYLLRTQGRDEDLEALERSAFSAAGVGIGGLPLPAQLELILITFENQVNRSRIQQLEASIAELEHWMARNPSVIASEPRLQDRMRQAIGEASRTFQAEFKDAAPTGKASVGQTLVALYNLALQVPDAGNATGETEKRIKIHFDLAEISFALKDYRGALFHYRWIAGQKAGSAFAQGLVEQSRLKAISSEYEILSAQGMFPKNLQAKPLTAVASNGSPSGEARQWIQSVDDFMQARGNLDRAKGEVFQFEADRLLYASGHVSEATERMLDQMSKCSDPKFATAMAALVMDTYVATQDWEKTFDIGSRVLTARNWDASFQKRLRGIIGDASFKQIEAQYKNKNYGDVLSRTKTFLADFPENGNRNNSIVLAANSALAQGDKSGALGYFAMLGSAKPEVLPEMLKTKLALAEEQANYSAALADLEAYLALGSAGSASQPDPALRKKAAIYQFLESETQPVSVALQGKGICVGETEAFCEHLDALAELESGSVAGGAKERVAIRKALHAGAADRAIWGAIALRNSDDLTISDRERILAVIASGWESEEPLARFILVPEVPDVVIESLKRSRRSVASSGKIRHIRKALIQRRVHLIAGMEKMASQAMKLPWARVRAAALSELAGTYEDLSSEIHGIAPPSGLSGADLTSYHQMIGQMTAAFDQKAADFDKKAQELDASAEAQMDSGKLNELIGELQQSVGDSSQAVALVRSWGSAVGREHWAEVAFTLNQMKAHEASQEICQLAEAVSIYSAGARAEGLAEIRSVQARLPRRLRSAVEVALQSVSTGSPRLPAAESRPSTPGGES